MPVSPARAAAFEILLRVETTDAYASELLHSARYARLSQADHRLLTELVMGVLRWRGLIDDRIAELSEQRPADRSESGHPAPTDGVRSAPLLAKEARSGAAPTTVNKAGPNQVLGKFDVQVLTALRLGAYQLVFLDRVPKHAAVNESVELVKSARKRSAAGLVNAVLRNIARSAPPQFSTKTGEMGHPEAEFSHPQWLLERWKRTYGLEVVHKICKYNQAAPETAVRVPSPHPLQRTPKGAATPVSNVGTAASGSPRAARLIQASRAALDGQPSAAVPTFDNVPTQPQAIQSTTFNQLAADGVQFAPGRLLTHAATVTAGDISRTTAFREQRLVIQDEASQLVALLVGRGDTILDCCAAPGGKTRIIAEHNPNAMVIAIELHPHRAALLRKLVSAHNVQVMAGDVRKMPLAQNFDRILVDAPCSGTGTLARNPEIKWRLHPEDLLRLQTYQIEILTAAMKRVAEGGRIVYSTCSLEPEENEEVIAKAMAAEAAFKVVDCRAELLRLRDDGELAWQDIDSLTCNPYLRTIPGVHPCDGFFAAILEKI